MSTNIWHVISEHIDNYGGPDVLSFSSKEAALDHLKRQWVDYVSENGLPDTGLPQPKNITTDELYEFDDQQWYWLIRRWLIN